MMNSTTTRHKMLVSALLMGGLSWFGSANAESVNLCAGEYDKTVGGVTVTMWGFALGGATAGTCDGTLSSPGPAINVGDTDIFGLHVTLTNTLGEPVSLIIPGQAMPSGGAPVIIGGRVRSFTTETASGSSTIYDWSSVKPGTYAYQSGTHPAVQVQMGLYGAMTHDFGFNEAYEGVTYDSQTTLIYSEIDPAMHAAIDAGTVGSYDGLATSTIGYDPRFFLVNGEVFNGVSDVSNTFGISGPGQRSLVRFINVGLEMHAPTINGARAQVVAEDGNVYPDYRDQYSVRLAAGKTKDAIITVPTDAAGASYAVYDRMLNVSNDGVMGAGGMMSFLTVGAGSGPLPGATGDAYDATEETLLAVDAGTGVLFNDTSTNPLTASLVSGVANGALTLNPDGSFDYTSDTDFFGIDSFTYAASDSNGSTAATVFITVANVNDAPVANPDAYDAVVGEELLVGALAGLLGNDSDVDGDALTATSDDLTIGSDGAFSYTPTAAGTVTASYTATDPGLLSSIAEVTITVTDPAAGEPPVAVSDFASVARNEEVIISVLANDLDSDLGGVGLPAADYSVAIGTPAANDRGLATANTDGTITFSSENVTQPQRQPRRGTASFTYIVTENATGATSEATVRVNVTR
jgi:FtsP/CotA-like multicopper oxidase with cupredoxin domain